VYITENANKYLYYYIRKSLFFSGGMSWL